MEIKIKSAPATFIADGEKATYYGRITSKSGIIIEVEAEVCRTSYTETPDGQPIQTKEVLFVLTWRNGRFADLQPSQFDYATELNSIINNLQTD